MPAALNRKPSAILPDTMPPLRLGIYGEGGVGKTTLCLTFPNPLVLDFDSGLEGDAVLHVEGDEWTADQWQDLNALFNYVKALTDEKQYGTIVIDSIDTLCTFLRHQAIDIPAGGRGANASETQLITASEQDYGRVSTAVEIFLAKLKGLSKARGVHIVICSAVREAEPEKGRMKRTFDCQPAVERELRQWCNVYGEMVAVEIKPKDGEGEPTEGRILWTKVTDPARKCKSRWRALRPGVSNPTFDKISGLIREDNGQ